MSNDNVVVASEKQGPQTPHNPRRRRFGAFLAVLTSLLAGLVASLVSREGAPHPGHVRPAASLVSSRFPPARFL